MSDSDGKERQFADEDADDDRLLRPHSAVDFYTAALAIASMQGSRAAGEGMSGPLSLLFGKYNRARYALKQHLRKLSS